MVRTACDIHAFGPVGAYGRFLSVRIEINLKKLVIYAGMNTGIQDVHNLAWKLASVVKGIAPKSILSTYETERRPVLIHR